MAKQPDIQTDVVLIGAGIMSATLGVFLKQLQPDWRIEILERLDEIAAESSAAWNNAGTGHSALCELNYTPQREDGSIDCSKAYKINAQFEVSKQFWAYLVAQKLLPGSDFIRPVPHMSFVRGKEDMAFLEKRVSILSQHPLFRGMRYSADHEVLKQWFPLMMEGRDPDDEVAASRMDTGTDVNFGALTWAMIRYLSGQPEVSVRVAHEVKDVERGADGLWVIKVKNLTTGHTRHIRTRFVFIGAGGGALHLLEKSDIPEAKGYGGFPVSGQWLRCNNPGIIERHYAKVYGKAAVGAPPMSVPHLDTRMINGKRELLFGPYAGFSTKFLKNGSYLDLPASISLNNIVPMIQVGLHNMRLTKYLIQQVRMSPEEKLDVLKEFYPGARMEDWELAIAGQRVQVIKKDEEGEGVLEFGTELVHAADGSIAALLGASPGASTSVSVMLDLLVQCFPEKMGTADWQQKLRDMIPSYGKSLADDPGLYRRVSSESAAVLQLHPPEAP